MFLECLISMAPLWVIGGIIWCAMGLLGFLLGCWMQDWYQDWASNLRLARRGSEGGMLALLSWLDWLLLLLQGCASFVAAVLAGPLTFVLVLILPSDDPCYD